MTDQVISPLRQRMIEDMAIRKFAPKTQHDYVQRVKDFATFLGRSPDTAKSEDVRRFRLHLASSGAGTPKINITVSALRFFFKVTLDRPELAKHLAFMHEPRKVPVVLSPEEVERPAWSDSTQEHVIAQVGRRSALEVGGNRVADLLRKRQAHLIARLPADPQGARFPLDVDETELRHVACPQPEACQQQDYRAVAPARKGFAITCSNQPIHLLRRQIPRHVGEPPIGVSRNDVVETCLAAAFDSEVPQECSQAGRQLLDGSTPALARAVHEVAANIGRTPAGRVRSKCRHQEVGITTVELDRGIGRPAMLAQPHFEAGDQLRLGRLRRHGRGPANADFDEVLAKEPGSENGVVVATSSARTRTSTGTQVLAERRQIDVV